MNAPFDWSRIEKLEAAIAWRREPENEAVQHVWHLDTVADLALALRNMLELAETDSRLISLLWTNIPGDNRMDVVRALEAPGNRYVMGASRLSGIVGNGN